MTARFRFLALLILCGIVQPTRAQFEERWIYGSEGLSTEGLRSYITGVDSAGNTIRDPGFDPRHALADDSGAFVLLPVNAGGGQQRPFLQLLLNLPWDAPRGYQVVRLDAMGQVLWHRFLRSWPSDYTVMVPALAIPNMRLVSGGGLLVETRGGLLLDPDGNAHLSTGAALEGCLDESEQTSASYRGYSLAEGGLIGYWYGLQGTTSRVRLCAVDPTSGVVEISTEPLGSEFRLLNYRFGVGALFARELSPGVQLLQMRREGVMAWQVEGRVSAAAPRIQTDGSTWVAVVEGWRRIGPTGEALGEISISTQSAPKLWLSGGNVVFADDATGLIRLVGPSGLTLWEQQASHSLLGAAWHSVGPYAYVVPDAPVAGSAPVLRIVVSSGLVDTIAAVSDTDVAWLALASGRTLSVRPGQAEFTLSANQLACGAAFAYCPASQDLVSQHVFDDGSAGAPTLRSFALPGEALPLAVASAVLPVVDSRDVVLVDRVFDGAKHSARAARIDSEGRKLWERTLGFDRSSVRDVVAGVGGNGVFVGARDGWPASQGWRDFVWKIDLAGQFQWRVETAGPIQQLVAVESGAPERICGLSTRADAQTTRHAWVCFDAADGDEHVSLLDHPPGWGAMFEGVVAGRARVRFFPHDLPTYDQFQMVEIDAAGTQFNLRNLAFQPSSTGGHHSLVAFLPGETSVGLANEHADAAAEGQAVRASLAAFSAGGTRLWQRTLPGPFRYSEKGVTTGPEIRRAANGDLLISLLVRGPLAETPLRSIVRLCRLTAQGADLGCVTAAFNGRPIDFVVPSSGDEVLVWLLNYDAAADGELQLVPWSASGLGSPVLRLAGFSVSAHGAVRQKGDQAWAVAHVPFPFADGLTDDPPPSTVVVSASRSPLFADGFE